MNICFVNDSFTGRGGANRVITTVANALQEAGNQITLIDFSGNNQFDYKVNSNIKKPNIIKKRTIKRDVIRVFLYLKNNITKTNLNVYDLFKEQTIDLVNHFKEENYDVIILCQGVLTALLPQIKLEINSPKFIVWQHSEYNTYVNQYYKRYIENYISGIKSADYVVCLTEKDRMKFNKLNINTICIYNPLTIKNSESRISNIINKNIIFVGSLIIETKGLDYLITIGKNIQPGWKIFVAGDGPDKKKFQKLITKNNLENIIILKGMLYDKELVDLYESSSVFISTSRWEGFGLVLTEAMSFGLPIVSFENNGPSEILKNGKYGKLIEKYNIVEFIDKLNVLAADYSIRKMYQNKSLNRVNDFKVETIVKQWEKLLI